MKVRKSVTVCVRCGRCAAAVTEGGCGEAMCEGGWAFLVFIMLTSILLVYASKSKLNQLQINALKEDVLISQSIY